MDVYFQLNINSKSRLTFIQGLLCTWYNSLNLSFNLPDNHNNVVTDLTPILHIRTWKPMQRLISYPVSQRPAEPGFKLNLFDSKIYALRDAVKMPFLVTE